MITDKAIPRGDTDRVWQGNRRGPFWATADCSTKEETGK
jgi:hypothetical protein